MKKFLLLVFTLLFSLRIFAQIDLVEKVPEYANTTNTNRAPNGTVAHTSFRAVMIIPASELVNIPPNTPLNQISFSYAGGTNTPTVGNIDIYLQNTTDDPANFASRSADWNTIISTMEWVYSDIYYIPQGQGIPTTNELGLMSPFTYAGGNLYVAYEYYGGSFATASAEYIADNTLPSSLRSVASTTYSISNNLSSLVSVRPQLQFGFTNTNNNDVKVSNVRVGRAVENKYFYPGNSVRALVKNRSLTALTNVNVTLTVTGANPYTTMQTLALLEEGEEVAVTFTGLPTDVSGTQTITVSVPSDDNNANNAQSVSQTVDCAAMRYYEPIGTASQASYGASSGIVAAKFKAPPADVPTLVKGVKVQLSSDPNALGQTVYGVVTDANGLILAQSDPLVIGTADQGTVKTFDFNGPTQLAPGQDFFLGLAMVVNGTAYLPINTYSDVHVVKQPLYGFDLMASYIVEVGTMGVPAIEGIVDGLPVTLTASATDICPGEQIALTGSASLAYPIYDFTVDNTSAQRSPGDTYTFSPAAAANLQVLGVYNGCTVPSNTVALTVKTPPTVDPITGDATICGTGTTQLATTSTGGAWSSSDETVATVDVNGLVTGVSAGTVTITYTLTANGCTGNATHNMTVNSPGTLGPITGVADLCMGTTATLSTTSGSGTWSTSNAAIATVDASGQVTPVAGGQTVTISYTVSDGSGCSGSVTHDIAIHDNPVLSAITGNNAVCVGASITLGSTPAGGVWSSDNIGAAAVNSSGEVTGIAGPGSAIITYNYTDANGCSAEVSKAVIVNEAPSSSPTIGEDEVCVNGTITLTNATTGGTWSSSNTAIAVVSSAGVVTGVADGFVVISYTITNGSGCSAVVGHPVDVHALPSVSAITGPDEVCEGETITLVNTTANGAWMSSDATIASVGATGIVTGVAAGPATITYEVTDVHGCKSSRDQAVTVNAAVVLDAITGDDKVCVDGSVTLANTTAGGAWSSSDAAVATIDNNGVVTGLTAGTTTITYTYTNASGCAGSVTMSFTVNAPSSAGTITGDASVCVGSAITLSNAVTGGVWLSDNAGIASVTAGQVTGVASGSTTIRYFVTSADGCVGTTEHAVTVNALPVVAAITGSNTVCEGSSITLANTTAGGVWGTTDAAVATVSAGTVTGVAAGTADITYTVTSGDGCVSVVSFPLTVDASPSAGTISGDNAVCEGSTVALSNTVSGGVWSSSNTAVASISGTGVVSGVSAGSTTITYTVTAGGCSNATTFNIGVNATPSAGVISGGTDVCEGSTLSLSSTATGGVWSSSDAAIASVSSTGVVNGLTSGNVTITYTVTSGSCSDATTQVVTVNALPSAGTISGDNAVCEGSTVTLSNAVTGGVWSSSNTAVASISSTGVVSGVSAGSATITYTVTTGGCSNSTTFNITVNATPSAGTISGGADVCEGSTINLGSTVTGGVWSSSDAAIASVSNTGVVNGLTSGNVTITYTVTSGSCSDATTQVVTVNALPSAGTISGDNAVCEGSTVTLSNAVTGGVWSSSNTAVASISSTGVVSGVSAGSATITYTVTTGGCSNETTFNITVNATPSAGVISGTNTVCTGNTVTLSSTATGGIWSSSNTAVASISGTGVVSGLTAGTTAITYTVTSNGCSDATTYLVTVNAQPSAGVISGINTVCAGSTVTLSSTATGGVWSCSNTAVASISGTGVVSGLTAGTTTITYTVTSNGCSDATTYIVTVNAQPSAGTISGTNTVCTGNTVTLSSTATGGVWSSSNTAVASISSTGVVSGVSAGTTTITYTVTSNGCSDATTYVVTVNAQPSAGIISGTNTVCAGSTVTLSSTASGGIWSSSNTAVASISSTGVVTGLTSGTTTITYTVTSNGCSDATTYIVTVNAQPSAGTISGTNTVCAGSTVTLNSTATGGVWSSSNTAVASISNTGVVSGLTAGVTTITYTVTSTGCSDATTYVVTVNAQPSAGTISGTNTVCAGSTVTLNSTATGGVWSSSNTAVASISNTGVVSGLTAGTTTITYTVISNGCSDATTYVVTVNAQPSAGVISGINTVCAGSTVTLSSTATGGVWSSSNTAVASISSTGVVSGVSAGTTTITYTVSNNGCSDAATYVVTVNAQPSAGIISGTNTVCAGSTVTLSSTATGGVWSSSNTAVASISNTGEVSGLTAGTTTITYTVTAGACSDATTYIVTVNAQPSAGAISGDNAVCTGSTLTLSNTVTGGVWSSSNNTVASISSTGEVSGLTTGAATITYTVTTGGCTASTTKLITVSAAPPVSAITGANSVCEGAGITLANTSAGGTWSSSNTAVATISNTGVVTAVATGTVTITYTITNTAGCSASTTHAVTVNALPANLTLTGSNGMCINGILTLTPSLTGGSWGTGNAAVATVSGGVVSGVSAGTATITYTLTNGAGCAATTSRVVTVNALPAVSAITGANTVCVGSDVTLSATPAGGVWSSSDINKAYISTAGVLSGISAGSATIRYTVNNAQGCSNTVEHIVAVSALPAVTPISGTSVICAGTTTQLSHAVAGGVWSSDNGAVATVAAGGLVTGVTAGTANIRYVITNAGGCTATATYNITVNALPQVSITTIDSVCLAQEKITLTSNVAGGTWSGEGVAGNQWTFGSMGAGVTTIGYTYTNTNGCTATATKDIRRVNCIDTRPGILASLDLYPNPALDWIRLKLDVESGAGKWNIVLTNLSGVKKMILSIELPTGQSERRIDISNLPQGIYFITISREGESKTLRFMKGR